MLIQEKKSGIPEDQLRESLRKMEMCGRSVRETAEPRLFLSFFISFYSLCISKSFRSL